MESMSYLSVSECVYHEHFIRVVVNEVGEQPSSRSGVIFLAALNPSSLHPICLVGVVIDSSDVVLFVGETPLAQTL